MRHSTLAAVGHPFSARLQSLWEATGHEDLHRLSEGLEPFGMSVRKTERGWLDATSSCLMDCYAKTGSGDAFAMLFELNRPRFLSVIRGQLRSWRTGVDAQDVLQQVFLRIYSYPHRFVRGRAESFHNWAHSVLSNTMKTVQKRESGSASFSSFDLEIERHIDPKSLSPLRSASRSESAALVDFTYLVYLNLYLEHYRRLSTVERRVLRMVEIDGFPYEKISSETGIRHVKSVVHRLRQRIRRNLERSLKTLLLEDS